MSVSLFAGIISSVIFLLFFTLLFFLVEGGLKNYVALCYFFLAALTTSMLLVNILVSSKTITHQYDLNDYFLITEVKNENKKYYYQLTFDSNNKIKKVEAEKIVWIFSKHDTDLEFDNIVECKEIKYRIIGTDIILKKEEKDYEKFRLFIKTP